MAADLLLLFFLLNEFLFATAPKGLEDVGVEERVANVVEFDLDLVQVIVQAGVENFFNRAKLEFGGETAT